MTARIDAQIDRHPLKRPIRIHGRCFEFILCVTAEMQVDGKTFRGEASPVYYLENGAEACVAQIHAMAGPVASGLSRAELIDRLPPGAARNALDAMLWERDAAEAGIPIWQLAGLARRPRPIETAMTIGVAEPASMARQARALPRHGIVKLKLNGDADDARRVEAVRNARREATIVLDANQGWPRLRLESMRSLISEMDVALVEQPVAVGEEDTLRGLDYPVPIAADESIQDLDGLQRLVGLFDIVNIKLDKCGGLTRGLEMAERARALGFGVMTGNMGGTSRSAAPQYLLSQLCDLADLDGPWMLRDDPVRTITYRDGFAHCSDPRWVGEEIRSDDPELDSRPIRGGEPLVGGT